MKDFWLLPQLIRAWIWKPDLNALRFWPRFGLRSARTTWVVISDLSRGDLNLRAMSLVYTTILSIVPLLAVSFSVLKGFGVNEQLETAMMRSLLNFGAEGIAIGEKIIEIVANVKAGVLGSLGLALLLYTVISLMQKIEYAFNYIWHVPQIRPLAQRFSGYLSVIIIGPVLVFTSLGISASLMNHRIVTSLKGIDPIGSAIHTAGSLVPVVLVIFAFTFIYVFMPNTRVRVLSAMIGAAVASILWHFAGWAFTAFVVSSAQYTAIYSAFAALIFFMLWLYVAWLVLLIGASVAFYHQNPDRVMLERTDPALSPRMMERAGLTVMTEIAADFLAERNRPTSTELAQRTGLRNETVVQLIELLAKEEFIVATGDSPQQWLPTRSPNTIRLSEVLAVMRSVGESDSISPDSIRSASGLDSVFDMLDTTHAEALADKTIGDLVDNAVQPMTPVAAE
ncbi:MAG: ribonuclease BN [Rhodospirillaceae bacterium]|nr:ribonuclease BN [Rhodospirillaceae bacterium]|tara:strand:- start:43394 stop:44749 length:1356 start_codon:yes stop_codon:yes gene_type:complete